MKKFPQALVISLSFIAFISLGLPDGLMGVAWSGIAASFNLPLDYLGMMLITGTAGYMLSSFFSTSITRLLGVGGLLSASCAITATALLVYAFSPVWFLYVIFSFFLGTGAGAIDAGINTFIARHYSERLMHWLHASFGVGITAGPVIMTMGIQHTHTWRTGYIIVGSAQLILAVTFFIFKQAWATPQPVSEAEIDHHADAPVMETLKKPSAYLSMLIFFLYTGVELGLGLWAYTLLTKARGVDPHVAGFITASYWGTFTGGRVLAGLFSHKVKNMSLIFGAVGLAVTGLALVISDIHTAVTILGIAFTGFALAPIFPGLVSDTENRVGRKHQATTIGMQLSAAGFGAAALPALTGVVADTYSVELIPVIMLGSLVLLGLSLVLSHVLR